jgi:hypothetical protein
MGPSRRRVIAIQDGDSVDWLFSDRVDTKALSAPAQRLYYVNPSKCVPGAATYCTIIVQ